jgi:hypothetical protein
MLRLFQQLGKEVKSLEDNVGSMILFDRIFFYDFYLFSKKALIGMKQLLPIIETLLIHSSFEFRKSSVNVKLNDTSSIVAMNEALHDWIVYPNVNWLMNYDLESEDAKSLRGMWFYCVLFGFELDTDIDQQQQLQQHLQQQQQRTSSAPEFAPFSFLPSQSIKRIAQFLPAIAPHKPYFWDQMQIEIEAIVQPTPVELQVSSSQRERERERERYYVLPSQIDFQIHFIIF